MSIDTTQHQEQLPLPQPAPVEAQRHVIRLNMAQKEQLRAWLAAKDPAQLRQQSYTDLATAANEARLVPVTITPWHIKNMLIQVFNIHPKPKTKPEPDPIAKRVSTLEVEHHGRLLLLERHVRLLADIVHAHLPKGDGN